MKSIQIGKVRLSVFADGMLLSVKSQASINRRLDEENTVYINKSKKSRNLRQYGQTERASREANKSTSLRERQTLYDLVCVCVCVCVRVHACACSVVSNSLQPCELKPISLLCPWNFPGTNPRVGCHFVLWGIFLTQRSKLCLLRLLLGQA